MKTISIFAITLMLLGATNVTAQMNHKQGKGPQKSESVGPMNHEEGIPNLTDEQKAKIKDLRIAHAKTVQPLQNQMEELRAKQHTLATSEKPDMKAIYANIDELTKVQNQIMKAMAAHNQDIRSLLTDEQRIRFDAKHSERRGAGKMRHGIADAGGKESAPPAHLPE